MILFNLIKPPYLKLILNQTPESYKHLNSAPVMLVWLSHGRFLPYLYILMVLPGSQHSGLIPLKTLYWGIQGRVKKSGKKGWMMGITDKCPHKLHEWGLQLLVSYPGKWLRKWHREIKHLVFLCGMYCREGNEWEARWATGWEMTTQTQLGWYECMVFPHCPSRRS